jgi:uroporphyrinogen-III synthase
MRTVIVLRPEPGASATLARARALGLDAISIPLFEVEAVKWDASDLAGFDALLLTSANAIRCGGAALEDLRALPVHAVGAATAEAAREAGFTIASSGTGGVDDLLDRVEPELRLLHLCGVDRRTAASPRQAIAAVPVYRSRAIDPPPGLDQAIGAVVLVHSPRAGHRLAELIEDRGPIAIAAISGAAAEAAGAGWNEIHIAAEPCDDALLALAARLCNTSPPE